MINKKAVLLAGVVLATMATPAYAKKVASTPVAATAPVAAPVAPAATTTNNDYQGFQAGDILVRVRALGVFPTTQSSVSVIGGKVNASTSAEPEIDATYFFTPNIAVEAIGAITRHHLTDSGSSLGNVDLGKTTLLPPTITAQYHFLASQAFSPYVGAGVNYTIFFDSTVPKTGAVKSIGFENTFGEAIQAGFDYHIQGNWYANVDVKHIFLATKAKINGGAINGYVSLDPTIAGIGIGYKF